MLFVFSPVIDLGVVSTHHNPPVEGDGEAWGFGRVEFQNMQSVATFLYILAKGVCFQLLSHSPSSTDH